MRSTGCIQWRKVIPGLGLFLILWGAQAQDHPSLVLTAEGVSAIQQKLGTIPLFDDTLKQVKEEVDAEIRSGILLPLPQDYSGGYTHERHKRNFLIMQKAGILFQVLGDEKYAVYVRDMLLGYAEMYPHLPRHPKTRSYARGKLFWQCLNDANWLVYTSQAYDCVYDWLEPEERTLLERDLFRPFADFISVENPQFFNRVHNHSTWGNVAVGMIGLVMNDEELVQRALYGVEGVRSVEGAKDDDGGFLREKGQKAGFLANLEEPFSPDGYYTEGPYYQRYAMYPFLIFAQALEQNQPELEIFKYKNGVLLKSVYALLNLSNANGEFFPLNDAQKGMSYYSRELVSAVDIGYHFGGHDPQLLSIAGKQGRVALSDTGLSVAEGVANGAEAPFVKRSVQLKDGAGGDRGGLSVIRKGDLELVYKYTAQGLSHGHYDKLSYSLYEQGHEVLQDYGLARFVNIEQKGGGNYLKENKTWAKQTIAHNALVLDRTSHFNGKYEIGSQHHSEPYFIDLENEHLQVVSATERNAYPGTVMKRTLAVVSDSLFDGPVVIDLLKVNSKEQHLMELPFYFIGQPISTAFELKGEQELKPMGNAHGYQHLYKEAVGLSVGDHSAFTWMNHGRFYTLTFLTHPEDEMVFGRIGANDPEFNLRRDPVLLHKRVNVSSTVFASVLEPHGGYSPVTEIASRAYSSLEALELIKEEEGYVVLKLRARSGESRVFIFFHEDSSSDRSHKIKTDQRTWSWTGPVFYGTY